MTALVSFFPSQRSIQVPQGTTILQAARLAGLTIESPCNSAGICGKCAVRLEPDLLGNVVQKGRHRLPREAAADGWVLSCETEVHGNLAVSILPREEHQTLRVLGHGAGRRVRPEPGFTKEYDPQARLTRLRAGGRLLAQEEGDTRGLLFGAVVDIGTTTIAASLVDLATGGELACAGALNPQSHHAQDVLSRIRFAATREGLELMQAEVLREISALLEGLSLQAGIDRRHLYEVVFSGNTCMLHLALGLDPASLGKYPYRNTLSGGERPLQGLSLPVAPCAQLYLPPVISAYVGPDITSGILATELHRLSGTTLLVDIGTNGEMVLACDGRLVATSTAAGPAFEGMNICCGMRASNGAVDAFGIDSRGAVYLSTIGGAEPVGICGSGLMDLTAELVANRVVGADGRFCSLDAFDLPRSLKERLFRQEGKPAFRITDRVFIGQKDIRQVQLAKGAVRAGIELLLRETGCRPEAVDRVLVAGSFGYHLRAESLFATGLLPPQFAGKVEFVGNTSKSGGEAFLLNQGARREMEEVVAGIEVLELANCPDFDRLFVKCLAFTPP